MIQSVRELLQEKGYDIWTVAPDDTVYNALKLMADKDIGAVLVIDSGNLVGILTERDYARKVFLKGKSSKDTFVREIMTENVVCVRTDQTIEECMALMTSKHLRHLPVLEDNQLVGMISIRDVVKAVISEREFIIEQLENYITGRMYKPTTI